jgi:penicillin amidase
MITAEDLKAALPQLDGEIALRGLKAPVEVYRDQHGIPHIRASSQWDAFLAQGFVTAQDRLWQMEYDRRRGAGRWAEVVGKSALEQDIMMRRFRLEASARADYEAVSDQTREMFDACARGVNAFIESTQTLPVEYKITGLAPEPWRPWNSLVVYKVRHILMGVFESKVWRARLVGKLGPEKVAALFPGYQPGHLLILPPGTPYIGTLDGGLEELSQGVAVLNYLNETDGGSNSWALSGSRTASGKPILAGDSHRALDTPNVYYQNHLACPEFDVVGLSFPGVPGFPHFGHNQWVAWCVTHTSADYQDLYIERFKPDDPRYYLYRGQWRQAEVFPETIKVRDSKDVSLESGQPITAR